MMNKEQILKEIKSRHQKELDEFYFNWAKENKICDIGDIAEDHYQRVKITKVLGYHFPYLKTVPYLVYEGIPYTKRNEPKKTGDKIVKIYGDNITKTIKE